MEIIDPDHDLMQKIAMKDVVAYRQLVERHVTFCLRVAERMVGNRQDAEDITQETCLKIWHEAPRWQAKAKFSTWLYRVLFNACLTHKDKVLAFTGTDMERFTDPGPASDEALISQQQSRRVQQALQRLPERQRAAIIFSYYEEISNAQAAESMGLKLAAFQQLLFRGKQNLKGELQEERPGYKNGT